MQIKPMLSHEYLKQEKKVSSWKVIIAQPKFDGIRATFSEGKFFSRNLKRIYANNLADELSTIDVGNIVLDGELIIPGEDFNTTASILKRSVNEHPRINEAMFVLFDCYMPFNPNATYVIRRAILGGMFPVAEFSPCKVFPRDKQESTVLTPESILDKKEIQDHLDYFSTVGWEGIMLRNGLSPYRPGYRSYDLLKFKKWLKVEATVIGMVEGQGKNKGMMGALNLRLDNGITFEVGTGFANWQRQDWWILRNGPPDTRVLIKYQELSSKGVPRFPVYEKVVYNG